METLIWSIILIGGYFLPAIIANRRKHKNENPISILNLAFGWTIIGWFACLAWAYSDNVKVENV